MPEEAIVFFSILAVSALLFFFGPLLMAWLDTLEERDRQRRAQRPERSGNGETP